MCIFFVICDWFWWRYPSKFQAVCRLFFSNSKFSCNVMLNVNCSCFVLIVMYEYIKYDSISIRRTSKTRLLLALFSWWRTEQWEWWYGVHWRYGYNQWGSQEFSQWTFVMWVIYPRVTVMLVAIRNDYIFIFLPLSITVSFTTMTFLTLFFMGKLHVFNERGRGQSWRLCASLIPMLVALAVAVSRTCDYHHHWQDVTIGSLIGITLAYVCYRQYYPPLSSRTAHRSYGDSLNRVVIVGETASTSSKSKSSGEDATVSYVTDEKETKWIWIVFIIFLIFTFFLLLFFLFLFLLLLFAFRKDITLCWCSLDFLSIFFCYEEFSTKFEHFATSTKNALLLLFLSI